MQDDRKAITRGIIIDVGHGGLDSGYLVDEELEKDMMLEISKYMYDRLKEMNIPVKIIRTSDETICMKKRFKKIQNSFDTLEDTILISNHLNNDLDKEKMKIIYSLNNNDKLSLKIKENLKKIGEEVIIEQKFLPSNPKKDFYEVLRYKGMDALRIEFNCKKNRHSKKTYLLEAEEILKAITEYGNLPYEERNIRKSSKIEKENTYKVKQGDTLWSIAKKFSVSKQALIITNNLSDNMVRVDSVLSIPNCDIHTVRKGDSIFNIANRYQISIDSLIKENDLENNKLVAGKYIRIPKSIE